MNRPKVYISKPTWGNHLAILRSAGLEFEEYPYWCPDTRGLDFEGMCKKLNEAEPNSVILLHPCAHNPTGVDPTMQQWERIADICEQRDLIPYFDSAY
mmetsp:Transcript_23903/g.3995  ORF Transcript_23903/g.3995 Transcript_23903/m.3995 type:complete len:98 (+) Transcript_23903:392-685(+)